MYPNFEFELMANKMPKLHIDTQWHIQQNGDYYINNAFYNSNLFVSGYVINFLKLANGTNSIRVICEMLNINVTYFNVKKVFNLFYLDLYPKGLLEEEEESIHIKNSYVKISLTIIPSSIVNIISKKLEFLFYPRNVAFILAFNLFVVVLFILSKNSLLFKTSLDTNIPLVFLLLLSVLIIHEFGHATALKYFNETPNKIGIGLYLLTPVLFADVTNSWKLTSKQRLVIDVGGLYFQTIATCLLFLLFFITHNESFLFTASLSFGIGLFNINPFMKTDGYWLLSDYFNIHNLKAISRSKSRILLHRIIKNKNINYVFFDYMLVLYSSISMLFIIVFFCYMFLYNGSMFINIIHNINKIFNCAINEIGFMELEQILLPFLTLIMLLKYFSIFMKKYVLKYIDK